MVTLLLRIAFHTPSAHTRRNSAAFHHTRIGQLLFLCIIHGPKKSVFVSPPLHHTNTIDCFLVKLFVVNFP